MLTVWSSSEVHELGASKIFVVPLLTCHHSHSAILETILLISTTAHNRKF